MVNLSPAGTAMPEVAGGAGLAAPSPAGGAGAVTRAVSRLIRSSAAAASQSSSKSPPSCHTMKSNRHLPCSVSKPAQTGSSVATSLGCAIRTDMETVVLGRNSFGLPIHLDRNAYEADGIILLNRIKPHTSFTGRYESGLLKMLTIGLGKREGAAQVHRLGLPGLRKLLPEVGAFLLEHAPVARRPAQQSRAVGRSAHGAATAFGWLRAAAGSSKTPKMVFVAMALAPSKRKT